MSRIGCGLRKVMVVVGVLALVVPLLLAWAAPVSAATITVCASGCDYTSIQDAVDAAGGGDVINVYPGTYNESVDLYDHSGALTLRTVNNAGNPTPGTVTVNGGTDEAFYTSSPHDGNITIDGFIANSDDSDGIEVVVNSNIVIRNVTASNTGDDGIDVESDGDATISDCRASNTDSDGIVVDAGGDVTVSDCIANGNHDENIEVNDAGGNATITGCTANDSEDGYGIEVDDVDGNVNVSTSTADGNDQDGIEMEDVGGNVTITDCTADGNDIDGFCMDLGVESDAALPAGESEESELDEDELDESTGVHRSVRPSADGGDVTITNCTAIGNGESGFDPEGILGTLTIQACIAMDNDHGVDLDGMWEAAGVLVNGSIICGNLCGIVGPVPQLNAEGNWWGCAGGPEAAGCDPICEPQADSIPLDFTPWIDSISSGASVDPVTVGHPTVVSFQFRGGPPAVYLGEGPGDLRGPAPFTVSTDNGTLNGNGATVEEFVNAANGTLQVTLVPDTVGTAMVTVSGPCGLANLEGAEAVVDVVGQEFVPEPATLLLLGGGLMGLGGYARLRLRKR